MQQFDAKLKKTLTLLACGLMFSCNMPEKTDEKVPQVEVKPQPIQSIPAIKEPIERKTPDWLYYESLGMVIEAYRSCEWLEANEPKIYQLMESKSIDLNLVNAHKEPCIDIQPFKITLHRPCKEILFQEILKAYGMKDKLRRGEAERECIDIRSF